MAIFSRRRLYWILGSGAALIAAAAFYIHFWLYLPEGNGPAGSAVSADDFAQPWSERQVLLLGVGDSVTAGLGSSAGHSYFQRLIENPDDEFSDMQGKTLSAVLPNLRSQNIAVSGSNSLQHLGYIKQKLSPQPDDVFGLIVMTSGGNDLIHWYGRTAPREGAMYGATLVESKPWIANFEQRLDQMFGLLSGQFPGGCLIFIADIYDPSDGYGNPESAGLPSWPDCLPIHQAYNAALKRAAAKHAYVRIVPMHKEFLGHGIHCRKFWTKHYRGNDPHYWYAFNLEDPNNRGYDAVRRLFLKEIAKEREHFGSQPDCQ